MLRSHRYFTGWSCFAGLVTLTACGEPDVDDTFGGSTELTYTEHIAPVIDAYCVACHAEGGIGPFPLDTYDAVYAVRGAVKKAVVERTMPPWLAADGCNEYFADRSLSDEQIALISEWVDGEAPRGTESGPPIASPFDYALSRVDRTLTMAQPYTPSPLADDEYRCFPIDWPETSTTFVTGFNTVPGDTRSVHHVIAFIAGPESVAAADALAAADPKYGYHCYGGPEVQASWLGVWTPGSGGADFPPGTGIRVEPGSKLILQVHYSSLNGPPGADETAVELKLDSSVEREAWIQPWLDLTWYDEGEMLIPAGDPDVVHTSNFDPTLFVSGGESFLMYTAGIHMHALGKSGSLKLDRADGSQECLLDIPTWDFHWQGAYGFEEPILVQPGDRLLQECRFDNSAENQLTQNGQLLPPVDVDWGEGTRDEMCLGAFYLSMP